jgi:hypothetical protein
MGIVGAGQTVEIGFGNAKHPRHGRMVVTYCNRHTIDCALVTCYFERHGCSIPRAYNATGLQRLQVAGLARFFLLCAERYEWKWDCKWSASQSCVDSKILKINFIVYLTNSADCVV